MIPETETTAGFHWKIYYPILIDGNKWSSSFLSNVQNSGRVTMCEYTVSSLEKKQKNNVERQRIKTSMVKDLQIPLEQISDINKKFK